MSSITSDTKNEHLEATASTVEPRVNGNSSNNVHEFDDSTISPRATEQLTQVTLQNDKEVAEEGSLEVARGLVAPGDEDDAAKEIERSYNGKPSSHASKASAALIETEKLNQDLSRGISYDILKEPLEDRKIYAKLRLAQSLTYHVLVEDRIKELEKKLADIELRLPTNEKNKAEATDQKPEAVLLKDKWQVSAGWFKTVQFCLESKYPAKPPHIIDVLREPMTALPLTKSGEPHFLTFAQLPSNESDTSTAPSLDDKVERIRINSDLISDAFRSVMLNDEKLLSPASETTHIRPFKALLSCEEGLREYADNLRFKIADRKKDGKSPSGAQSRDAKTLPEPQVSPEESVSAQSTSNSDEPTKIEPLKTAHSDERDDRDAESLKHIDALLSFLDGHLAEDLKLYKAFQSGSTSEAKSKIAFADLWILFAPGNIIYNPAASQALQVLAVSGGRPILRWDSHDTSYISTDNVVEFRPGEKGTLASIEAKDGVSPFAVTCFSLDFDGEFVGPVQTTIKLDPFDGQRDITALSIYPIQYAAHSGCYSEHVPTDAEQAPNSSSSVQDKLIERGKVFAKLISSTEVAHRDYGGLTLDKVQVHIDSDVIIDYSLYLQQHPDQRPTLGLQEPDKGRSRETRESLFCACECASETCTLNIARPMGLYDDRKVDEYRTDRFIASDGAPFVKFRQFQDHLKNEHCILFPNFVPGFVLKTREWCSLDLHKVKPLQSREQSFKDLILPKGHKEMVESLVRMHAVGPKPVEGSISMSSKESHDTNQREDLVRGKGKGLIILLHGVPGVGKTSTAECVAEYTKRPLYALTCGDIGESPGEVQQKLSEAFKFAHRWGCVMLLDEADVFLQARDKTDMKRNAVVSVFLRTLEYYSGILFLTTNKVGYFDEAFKSRINVALYYKPLDPEASDEIWKVNLRRIEETKKHISFSEKKIMKWAEKYRKKLDKEKARPWNGRQIHNAVQTAVALAAFLNSNVMTADHFKAVAEATEEFDYYLKSTHGTDDIGVAEREKSRGDDVFNRFMTPVSDKKSKKKSKKKQEPSSDESSSSSEGSDSSDED